MTIAAGVRLGPYEILAPLGAGGMGRLRGRPAPDEFGRPRLHREPSRLDAHVPDVDVGPGQLRPRVRRVMGVVGSSEIER
jgi:hypothetical protein